MFWLNKTSLKAINTLPKAVDLHAMHGICQAELGHVPHSFNDSPLLSDLSR